MTPAQRLGRLCRWEAGMLDTQGRRAVDIGRDGVTVCWARGDGWEDWSAPHPDAVPDTTDPATMGCLLGQYLAARQAWSPSDKAMVCVGLYGLTDPRTAEALADAWEAL